VTMPECTHVETNLHNWYGKLMQIVTWNVMGPCMSFSCQILGLSWDEVGTKLGRSLTIAVRNLSNKKLYEMQSRSGKI